MARQSRYEIYLLNNPKLTFRHCTAINPACFLTEPPQDEEEPSHDCLSLIQEASSVDVPMEDPDCIMYVDGSSSINPEGTRISGYAIVNQENQVLESAAFETAYSAQQAELFALTQACILAKDLKVNIYTDSRYAFGVAHDFGQLWKNRGFLTSQGNEISHRQLVSDLLQALMLPKRIAIVKCTAHTTGNSLVDIGNRCADKEAKKASCGQQMVVPRMMSQTKSPVKDKLASEKPMPTIQNVIKAQEDAPEKDKLLWKDYGCTYDNVSKLWTIPAEQTCMSDELVLWVIECMHFATHCGAKTTSDMLLATWWHPRLQMLAQIISSRCLVCQQHNPGKGVPCDWGKTPLPEGPFETLQLDYIELQKVQCYKYVLVIVDVFSRWIEAYPTLDNKAQTVVKVLIREIVPRYGIPARLMTTYVLSLTQALRLAHNQVREAHLDLPVLPESSLVAPGKTIPKSGEFWKFTTNASTISAATSFRALGCDV
uniref:protein NYNRIN-like n=1 Tax=Pristiophorus japonicus TaxID=55135 RepID=UPI00398F01E9